MSNWPIFGGSRLETLGDDNGGMLLNNGGVLAHTEGPWTLLGTSSFAYNAVVLTGTTNSTIRSFIDIGIGAPGAQVEVVSDLFMQGHSVTQGWACPILPVHIPAGVEVWGRHRAHTNSAIIYANLTGMAFDIPTPFPAGCRLAEGINLDYANTIVAGTVTMSGDRDLQSAWYELVASTSRRYVGFVIAFCDQTDNSRSISPFTIDIAIGAAGSEIVLIENVVCYQESTRILNTVMVGPFFVDVPEGTRISARVHCNSDAADNLGIALTGLVP